MIIFNTRGKDTDGHSACQPACLQCDPSTVPNLLTCSVCQAVSTDTSLQLFIASCGRRVAELSLSACRKPYASIVTLSVCACFCRPVSLSCFTLQEATFTSILPYIHIYNFHQIYQPHQPHLSCIAYLLLSAFLCAALPPFALHALFVFILTAYCWASHCPHHALLPPCSVNVESCETETDIATLIPRGSGSPTI